MGAKNIGALVISLTGDTKQFQSSMTQATGGINGLMGSIKASLPMITTLTATIGVASVAIKKIMQTTLQYGMELSVLSKKTGESVENISKLGYAAQVKETSIESLGTALKFLNRNIDEAKDKSGESAKAFERAGISIYDVQGKIKPASDILLELSEFMSNKTIPASEKTRIAMQLMGRSGVDMIPMLAGGRKEIEALTKEAETMGLVLSNKDIKAIEELDDSMDKLKASIKGIKIMAGEAMVPFWTDWIKGLQIITQRMKEATEESKKQKQETDDIIEGQKLGLKTENDWANFRIKKARERLLLGKQANETIEEEVEITRELTEEEKKLNEEMAQLNNQYSRLNFYTEDYISKVTILGNAIKEQYPDWDKQIDLSDALNRMLEDTGNILENTNTKAEWFSEQLGTLADPFVQGWAEAMWGVESSSKKSFDEILKDFGVMITEMLAKAAILTGLKMLFGAATGGFGSIFSSLLGFKEGGVVIPHAAEGMIVEHPTPVMVGEGGKPEIISPVDKLFDFMGKMQPSITVHSADPNTTVEFFMNMPRGVQDKLFRKVFDPAQTRSNARA